MYSEVVEIYVAELHRPDLARTLAGDDYRRLNQLSKSLIATTEVVGEHSDENLKKEYVRLAEEINADVVRILIDKCKSTDATAGDLVTLAGIHHGDKDFQAAITYYRRALNLNYEQVGWRMALARALAETGQVDQAIHEARICLRLRPQLQAARKLIEDMSVQQPE